jgi:membrane-associated progesterone receptor component
VALSFLSSSSSSSYPILIAEAFCTPYAYTSSLGRSSIQRRRNHDHQQIVTIHTILDDHAIIEPTIIDNIDNILNIIGVVASGYLIGLVVAWWVRNNGGITHDNNSRDQISERDQLAYIEPRVKPWTDEELLMYNGTNNNNAGGQRGPILMAIKNHVFNVGTNNGYQFYGPNGDYHIMAGRDASRFLAKNIVIEETIDEKNEKLSVSQEANLEMWYWIIKNKYPCVGTYAGYNNNNNNNNTSNNSKNNNDDAAIN